MFDIYLKGFFLGASLIMAIGLQNAFVLRQGIKNHHIFATAFTAGAIDAILIFAGVFGFGTLIKQAPFVLNILTCGGAIFLFFYGMKSFFNAFKKQTLEHDKANGLLKENTLKETIILLMGFSFLNPHVYLDTVVLIGGLSATQGEVGKLWFGLGAACASFVWFFSLAYGGNLLAPIFKNPRAWQILDIIIGIIMLSLSFSLIWGIIHSS